MREEEAIRRATDILRDVFPDSMISHEARASDRKTACDLELTTNGHVLIVDVRTSRSTRILDLEGRLALASLQATRSAAQKNALPVVMIALPKLGPKALHFAANFINHHTPDVGWCLFDLSGAYSLNIPALAVVKSRRTQLRSEPRSFPTRGSLFSDLNRWMLKLLLLREVPDQLWGGPKQSIMHARELRVVAGVSPETAYSFVRTFESAGYIQETNDGIIVTRRAELVRTWLTHELSFRSESIPVRWIFGNGQELTKVLLRSGGNEQFAVTGFEACRMLGILHAPVPRKEVCVHGDIATAIQNWNLHRCDARDADFFILRMANPKSVLKGSVIKEGLPVVDVLEAAFSVYGQAPRGEQQAEFIFRNVLHWEDVT
jgi:hypothetical protein